MLMTTLLHTNLSTAALDTSVIPYIQEIFLDIVHTSPYVGEAGIILVASVCVCPSVQKLKKTNDQKLI